MPELPEVETICRGLQPKIKGKIISDMVIYQHQLRYPIIENLAAYLVGQQILDVMRRAKYLIFKLTNGNLVVHLGMSGYFRIYAKGQPVAKHDHVVITLNNQFALHYNDTRRFGFIRYLSDKDMVDFIAKLSVEPLSSEFNREYLANIFQNKSASIKTLLMNNKVVVGIGNIYAQESLFQAKISPLRAASSLSSLEIKCLVDAIKQILTEAIAQGGTTLKDFSHTDGKPGYFKQQLNIYARGLQNCSVCKTPITQIKQAGRTTCFCSSCQL